MKKLYKYLIISLIILLPWIGTQAFGAVTTLIADEIYSGNYIVAADELNVPDTITGCAIYNTTVRGKLDLDEGIETGVGAEELNDPGLDNAAEWDDTDANVTQAASVVTWNAAGAGFFFTTEGAGQFTVGKLYKIVVVVDVMTAGLFVVPYWDYSFQGPSFVEITAAGTYTYYLVCTNDTDFAVYGDAACDAVVSNISVTEVTFLGGVHSSIFAEVDLAGVEAAETAEFFNCKFVEAQVVIEATLGVGGTVWFDDDCEFSIVTATHFTNYAGDDCTLKPGSPYRHGGTYTPGYVSKLRPAGGVMDDILSVGGYAVPRGSAGM